MDVEVCVGQREATFRNSRLFSGHIPILMIDVCLDDSGGNNVFWTTGTATTKNKMIYQQPRQVVMWQQVEVT